MPAQKKPSAKAGQTAAKSKALVKFQPMTSLPKGAASPVSSTDAVAIMASISEGNSIWFRQPSESATYYAYFAYFRDLPPQERTFTKAAEMLGVSDTVIRAIAKKHSWTSRALAMDDYIQRMKVQDDISRQLQMSHQHAEIAEAMLNSVRAAIKNIDPDRMRPHEVARWAEVAVKIERLSRGLSTENVAARVGGSIALRTAALPPEVEKRLALDPIIAEILDAFDARIATLQAQS